MGLVPGQKEHNQQQFQLLLEDSDKGNSFRAQVARIIESQNIEFWAHGIELGFRYTNGFLIPDGSIPAKRDPLGQQYFPTTQPGHRLPHAWIERRGQVLPTQHLVGGSLAFVLITDGEGSVWQPAAERVSERLGVPVVVAQIGRRCLYRDHEDRWEDLKGIQTGGAILVRPDNIVAWRSIYRSRRDGKELEEAADMLLRGRLETCEGVDNTSQSKL